MEAKCQGLEESWKDLGKSLEETLKSLRQEKPRNETSESEKSTVGSDSNLTLRKT